MQECHNNDAIKACKKDSDNYAVSERREDLVPLRALRTVKTRKGKGSRQQEKVPAK